MIDHRKSSGIQLVLTCTVLPAAWFLVGPAAVVALALPALAALAVYLVIPVVRERDDDTALIAVRGLL